ncbi:MAG: hypothetical protein BWZ05_00870 [Bacteroidetes bacterium ADurb.BinA245]|nr:MAG: hypothetical protein BWZ05_00870 [Bacteroidetes bacterium ADurb.BinA245]
MNERHGKAKQQVYRIAKEGLLEARYRHEERLANELMYSIVSINSASVDSGHFSFYM